MGNFLHPLLSVREIQPADIPHIVRYWQESTPEHLLAMGVDLSKVPSAEKLTTFLSSQIIAPLREKESFCMIWCEDGQPIGHNNINNITFGEEATMHLHLWHADTRQKGIGTQLLILTLPHFFEKMQLKKLVCEPYSLNPAPNKTLERAGFRFVKEYITIPGTLNFEQPVKRWELSRDQFTLA